MREGDGTLVVRFLGDPTGYISHDGFGPWPFAGKAREPYWVWVDIGTTGKKAYVDISKAYFVGPL